MQGEDIMEHTNGKSHVFTFSKQEEDVLEHTSSVVCVYFSQFVDHCVT